jgi:nucleosome assembly protein 1-like 1
LQFAVRYAPLYQRRSDIVSGASEPTEAELAAGADEDDDDENDAAGAAASSDEDKGIPDFWLIALRNHVGISELSVSCMPSQRRTNGAASHSSDDPLIVFFSFHAVTEEDEDALHHLRDIQLSYLEATKPGFKLTFVFDANEYFENTQLEKVYYYQEEVGYGGDLVYDRAEGTEIIWKEDKDLTRKVEIKKQRNKSESPASYRPDSEAIIRADPPCASLAATNRTRVVKVVKPSDSFFNFFKPPTPPTAEQLETGDVDEAELQELDERLELDYQIGEDLKERIIREPWPTPVITCSSGS